jgi:AcrR family transcriptional regulator
MPDRRTALVDAGVELVLQQCFQDLLASVDTRSITAKAGVTTGSFFHHFRNRAAFTDAVIERLEELWEHSTERSLSSIATFTEGMDFQGAAAAEWQRLQSDERNSGLQHLLLAVPGQPVSEDASRTAADVLAARYAALNAAMLPAYRRGLEAIGREVMPPFTDHDLAVALTALGAGLKARHVADAGSVRPDLYADLVSALVIAVTRPVGEQVPAVETLSELDRPVVVRAVVGSDRPGTTWRQIADAAAPLFVDRTVGEVRIAEIAEVAGVSASTVYQRFGSVSAVAAASWARYVPELAAIASEPLTTSEGPIVRMEQVLTRYIQLGRENRGALEGQVLEGVARASGGAPEPTSTLMPLASLLIPHIRELRARGVLRRRIDSEGLARSVLQLTAMRVLASPEEPDERIIDETLGMLLEGALARQVR